MKRSERICVITHILTENPNRDYSLGSFAELFGCAKSSVSEDLRVVRSAIEDFGIGYIETTSGAKGGVRFVPYVTREQALPALENLRKTLEDPSRVLGGGFLYTSDVIFNPEYMKIAARQFAKKFAACEADFVVTLETSGVGVAMMTAELLNLPLVVIGRETRVSDGSTISINYWSGSSDRIQKMSVSKRAIKPKQKAIVIDDFLRQGGSIKGIVNMLAEFDASASGIGVVMAANINEEKEIKNYFPILILDDSKGSYAVSINPEILNK